MQFRRLLLFAVFGGLGSAAACQDRNAGLVRRGDDDQEPPRWHFERLDHRMGEMTLNDVWGRDDGAVFVVGWYGTIFTNRVTRANPSGAWKKMESNTTEHLTAIWGVYNGDQFHQANRRDGEMFAVGWTGTLLHYHPNPANTPNPVPEDGRWEVIAGPGKGLTPRIKVDPFCPDADGDGVLDDGGGNAAGGPDGWWSLKDTCRGGATTQCDDNCRLSPNGSLRPLVDLNNNFGHSDPDLAQNCIEWNGDGPSSDVSLRQQDTDNDGVGSVCDDSTDTGATGDFLPALFDVWAAVDPNDATRLVVVAVGEDGAVVTYQGPNGAQPITPPARGVNDPLAWIAQEHVGFWFSSDCPFTAPDTLPGQACGSGRLPPSCAAQCNSYRPRCDCAAPADGSDPVACCVTGDGDQRLVGAACVGPGCTSTSPVQPASAFAANGCAGTPGVSCSTLCPFCFRTLNKTLRSLAVNDGGNIVAIGAGGTVVTLGLVGGNDPTGVWVANDFGLPGPPAGMDERGLLTAISQRDGGFHVVGAAGLVAGVNPGGTPMVGAVQCLEDNPDTVGVNEALPAVFLSGVFSLGDRQGYAVGDRGTLVEFRGAGSYCEVIDTDTVENFLAIWVTYVQGVRRLWMVGANGTVVRGGYY